MKKQNDQVIHERNQTKKGKSCLESEDSKSLITWKMTRYEAIWRTLFLVVIILGFFVIEKVVKF
jgi:hypothetical protein